MEDLSMIEKHNTPIEIQDIIEKLKEHYVYELIDPRDNKVFYIGKGKGERAHHHEVEADTNDINSNKLNRIRDIKDSGSTLAPRVIGRYDTEEEAFAVESTLIHWIYGKNDLTNIAGGHNSKVIRPKGNLSEIPGIDIPPREKSNDGSYSLAKIEEREANGVVPYMKDVKEQLEKILNIRLSEVDTQRAKFTYLYFPLENCRLAIVTQNRTLAVELQALSTKQHDKKVILGICEKTIFEKRNEGAYAKLPTAKGTKDIEKIAHEFVDHLKILKLDLKEETIKKRWSQESITLTRQIFDKQNGCLLKSFDGIYGVGVRKKDHSYIVVLTEEVEQIKPLVYQTFDSLVKAGWVLD